MKTKFLLSISLAVFVGLAFANGVTLAGKTIFDQIAGEALLISGSQRLSANVVSGARLSDLKIIEVTDEHGNLRGSEAGDVGLYYSYPDSKPFPAVSAESYLVADLETGQVIKQKGIEKQYPIASITKLLTALTSLETLDQNEIAVVSPGAVETYGDQGGLQRWQKISVGDLLYPLLLESSNDAAEVLAEHAGRKAFISNLNGIARSIGMEDTFFADPSGLSSQNFSTAKDLFKMMQYLYKNGSDILEITKLREYRDEENLWSNLSDFRNDANYLGGKNGYTDEALYTLITSFALPLSESEVENRNIVIILLRSGDTTEEDTRRIIYWLLRDIYYE